MGHKKNDLSKGIGVALKSVSKLLGGIVVKEDPLPNSLPKIDHVLPTNVGKCQSEELIMQESFTSSSDFKELPATNDFPTFCQSSVEEYSPPIIVEEKNRVMKITLFLAKTPKIKRMMSSTVTNWDQKI